MRVLTWNLFHGRSQPPAGRDLFDEFAGRLARWEWDVALLQEVLPWWPGPLAHACGALERHVLTSRNFLLPVRKALFQRWPDRVRSNGGGANAILVRRAAIADHRTLLLRTIPERRRLHAVRLASGVWVANLHASNPEARAAPDDRKAAHAARHWADGVPLVFGGDLNWRRPELEGLRHVAGHHVDHLFVAGLEPAGPGRTLQHTPLSDHAPLEVELSSA